MKLCLQRFFLVFFVVSLTCVHYAVADGKQDFYIQQATRRYFNLPQNARTFGMAGSSVVTSQDSSSVIGNPAGLGFMKEAEISGTYEYEKVSGREQPSYARIDEDIDNGHALGAFPLAPNYEAYPDFGNLGLGWSGYRSDVNDSYGTETDGYRIHAAYGKALNDSWSAGYGFTYVNDQLNNDVVNYGMDNGYKHTVGVQNKVSDALTLGASVFYGSGEPTRDIEAGGGPAIHQTLHTKSYGGETGLSYDFGSTLLATSLDWEEYEQNATSDAGGNESGRSFAARIGIEQEIFDWLVGRLGYRYQGNIYFFGDESESDLTGTAKYNAASWGAGMWLGNHVRMDYGGEYRWVAYNDFANTVSLTVPFSICEEDLLAAEKPE